MLELVSSTAGGRPAELSQHRTGVAVYDVTWGQGGPEQTVRCFTIECARDAADMARAWGSIIKPAGQCPWQIDARTRGEDDTPGSAY